MATTGFATYQEIAVRKKFIHKMFLAIKHYTQTKEPHKVTACKKAMCDEIEALFRKQ